MVLIDLHQLVALYKLCRTNACFSPVPSHLPPMATTPPHSPLPSAKQDNLVLVTPRRDPSVAYDAPGSTPYSRGSSTFKGQADDMDKDVRYKREDYDDYIREDLHGRVFVGFDAFIRSVLHVPDNWKDVWGPAIAAVKANERFTECHTEYCQRCNQPGLPEKSFYEPFVNTANAVLDVLSGPEFDDTPTITPQYYRVNDPKRLLGGVMNLGNLCPDLLVLHQDCRPPAGDNLHWANPLHVIEVKPYDSTICDGKSIPRLLVGGKCATTPFCGWLRLTQRTGIDPILNHAPPPSPKRFRPKKNTPISTPTNDSSTALPEPNKRRADELYTDNQPTQKKLKTPSTIFQERRVSTTVGVEEGGTSSLTTSETQAQAVPSVQVCSYLLEMFSVPLLRSHATVCLVDRDRLQLYHANHSVILVSSAINFSGDEGLDKLIAVIFAFRRLSLKQSGILTALPHSNGKMVKNPKVPEDHKVVQSGKELELVAKGEQNSFKVILGDVIFRNPAVIGRSTVVLKATSGRWPQNNLAVKVSWPSSGRVSEGDFIEKAIKEAKQTDGEWAIKHLPRLFFDRQIYFDKDSTCELVAELFKDAEFASGNYVYERRLLRIIIQEELYPLRSLSNVKDIGQVFVDVACGTSPFPFLIDVHLFHSSSPLALRCPWDPSP